MSMQIDKKILNAARDKYYSRAIACGLSERDANIVATRMVYPQSGVPLANRYGLTAKEVKDIWIANSKKVRDQ